MTGPLITGLGVLAPTGLGAEQYWRATAAGQSGLRPLTRFDGARYQVPLAGQIDGFDDTELPERLLSQTDRTTRLALSAAEWALADAGLEPADGPDYAMGTAISCAAGGFEFGQRELEKLWKSGSQYVSGYQSFAWFYAVNTGQVSIRNGLRGSSTVLVTEQASGLDSIGYARRQLARDADSRARIGLNSDGGGSGPASRQAFLLAGGMEAALCPWGLTAQATGGTFSGLADPDTAYLPFDLDTAGAVPGEGGAVLVIEDRASAEARGSTGYAAVTGWAATFDCADEPAERGLIRAASTALADAELEPDDIDVVFADAAGVAVSDRAEAAALAQLFGAGAVPVSAPKAGTGRLCAGGSALDVATAALALRHQLIPPTPNVRRPDPSVDLVIGAARPARLRSALILARGFGGFNSALVLRHPNA